MQADEGILGVRSIGNNKIKIMCILNRKIQEQNTRMFKKYS